MYRNECLGRQDGRRVEMENERGSLEVDLGQSRPLVLASRSYGYLITLMDLAQAQFDKYTPYYVIRTLLY